MLGKSSFVARERLEHSKLVGSLTSHRRFCSSSVDCTEKTTTKSGHEELNIMQLHTGDCARCLTD